MYIILYYALRLFSGFCARVWERRTCRVHDARIVAEKRHVHRYDIPILYYNMGTPSNGYGYKYVIWDPTTREATVIGIISNRKVYRNVMPSYHDTAGADRYPAIWVGYNILICAYIYIYIQLDGLWISKLKRLLQCVCCVYIVIYYIYMWYMHGTVHDYTAE